MDIRSILQYNYPDAAWSLVGDSYDGLEWLSGSGKPTEKQLKDAWPGVQKKMKNAQAESDRAQAYRAEADPLFFYWQSGEGTEQAWLAKRAEIRARYPYVS